MIFVTSLSPTNTEIQKTALKSWEKYAPVICLQSPEECEGMRKEYPNVEFVSTLRTSERLFTKKLIQINAFLDLAKERNEDLFIINSDIYLTGMPELKEDGISVFQRMDYDVVMDNAIPFANGYDGFYIPNKFISIYPPSIYAMGACWWDYMVPYKAIVSGIPLYLQHGIAYHKKHSLQWPQKDWNHLASYFKLENSIPISDLGKMGQFVLQTIKNYL